MDKISGIYQIKNIINNHRYLGSSVDMFRRIANHKCSLRGKYHHSIVLQRAWDKYGEDKFVFQILCLCSKEDTLKYEQLFLDNVQHKYNIANDAKRPQLGRVVSAETRAKLGLAGRGREVSAETRAKISAANSGRHPSVETRKKIGLAGKGREPWNKGKTGVYSEAHIIRMSMAHKGKRLSAETRAKMSAARMGHKVSNITRKKLSIANRGRKHTEEARRKMSEAQKGRIPWNKGKTNVYSDEVRKSMGRANIGRVVSEETKRRIGEAKIGNKYALGYKHTPESRARMSARAKEQWRKRGHQ